MGRSFASLIGCALTLGFAAGALDLALAAAQGRAAGAGAGVLLLAASTGAALAVLALVVPAAVLAVSRHPRSPGAKVGVLLALAALAPAAVPFGRAAYKRLPWDGADVLFALAVVAGLAAAAAALGSALARALSGRRGEATARFLARASLPAALLLLPFAIRVVPALGPLRPVAEGKEGPDNLLLLSIDTMRADALGVMGDPAARTPWIDGLARRSVVYVNCVSPSPWTLPSLGSMLTGTYPGEHRLLQNLSTLSGAVPSLAAACRAQGLRTAAVVSNPWLATGALGEGFDTFEVAERLECLWPIRGTRIYTFLSKTALRVGGLDRGDRLSARAVSWLRDGRGAWFLWVHYFDPHLPNWPGAPWDRMFGPPPERVGSSVTVDEIRDTKLGRDAGARGEIERLYAGEVARTDRAIGRVLGWLRRSGRADETAVVFSVDHGEEFWDHGGYGHGHEMYEEVVRVPLFVRPAATGGAAATPRIETRLVRLVDLAPTALAAAGLEPPVDRAFTGTDLLAGADVPVTYGEATLYGEEQKYLRSDRWKLVYRPDGEEPRLSLFDLARDPGERHDLAAAEPAVRDSLFTVLQGWMERVGSEGSMAARDVPGDLDPSIRDQLKSLGYIP